MNDRFIRLSISLARLQKVIQRIKASGMSRIELKAGHTLVLCRLAAASEGLHFSELTERCGLDPAMISRVLAELVRSGLVEKRAESGKYNALYLLTNAGHDRAARVGAVVADVERRADEGIDPDDLATFNVQNCPAAPKRSRALVLFIFGGYTEKNISSGRYNRLP